MAFTTYDKADAPDLVSSTSVLANKLDAFVSGSSVRLAPYTESAKFDVGYYESGSSGEGKAYTAMRKIVNVMNPDADTDAANKSYVDQHSIGYSIIASKLKPASNDGISYIIEGRGGRYSSFGTPDTPSTPTVPLNYSIESHDLTIIYHQYIGDPPNTAPSVMTVGLSGSIDVTTTFSDTCDWFTYEFPCAEPYISAEETIQKPIMVIGCASDGTPYYFGYACFDTTGPTTLVQGTLWSTGKTVPTSPGSVQRFWFYS